MVDSASVVSLLLPIQDRGIAESKKHKRESVWPSTDLDTKEILRQLLLSNSWPEIVAYDGPTCSCNAEGDHDGPSSASGQSACALISMYCARTILDLEKQVRAREYRSEGRSKEEEASGLLGDILAERTVQKIVSIGAHLKGAVKMGLEELLEVPLFEQVFAAGDRRSNYHSYDSILALLDQLCRDSARRIAATVVTQASQSALCVRLTLLEEEMFIVFDPHPRVDHPNGPGFMLSTSRATTASFLNHLLESSVPHDVTGTDVFQTLPPSPLITAHLLNAKDNYHRIASYQNEQMLRDSYLCSQQESLNASVDYVNLYNQLLANPDVGPSGYVSRDKFVTGSSSGASSSSSADSGSLHHHNEYQHPLPALPSSRLNSMSDSWRPDTPFGQYLREHMKILSEAHKLSVSASSDTGNSPQPLLNATFDCSVCLETLPVYKSVMLLECRHQFCAECLKGHTKSFLDNGRFPIQCPLCLLDGDETDPGNVSEFILRLLKMPQELTDKYKELQILQHSVRLECPSCNKTDLVLRKDFLKSKVLQCDSCCHQWCKACSKAMPTEPQKNGNKNKFKSSQHACKGDGFEKLMKKKGWRYCPGCTMPVTKDSGCNHMSCTAPGCHTHFCYKCGKLIVVSATGRNVGEEVTMHYLTSKCRQFERRLACSIQ